MCRPACAAVGFTAVFLMDIAAFPPSEFSSLVSNLTSADSVTVQTVEADTMTGIDGRRLFVNSSSFYTFQLLHVTRVRVSVLSEDDQTASAVIRHSLPHETALSGIGVMGLDGVDIEASDPVLHWFTATHLELPGFVAQYLVLGWALTVALMLCYCCCCCGDGERELIPVSMVHEDVERSDKTGDKKGKQGQTGKVKILPKEVSKGISKSRP